MNSKSFPDAQSAQNYAKQNPGTIITRAHDGSGYIISNESNATIRENSNITPKSILEYLDQHVISQDEAKEEIALALYYHHVNFNS